MGGGGAAKNQSTTTSVQLPPWLEGAIQQNVSAAADVSQRPYEAYGGDRVAQLSDLEQRGLSLAGDALAPGSVDLATQRATAAAGGSLQGLDLALSSGAGLQGMSGATAGIGDQFRGTMGPQGLVDRANTFLSPYTQHVVDAGIADLERTGEGQRRAAVDRASRAGAWGDRLGVQEGVQAAETARAAGTLSSQLRDQAWTRAMATGVQSTQLDQAALTGALGAQQAAGQQLLQAGQLGNAATQGGLAAASAAGIPIQQLLAQAQGGMTLGSLPRSIEQANLDVGYQNWQDQWNYPMEMLALRQAAVSGTPYGGTSTTSAPVYRPSAGASAASGAMAGAAAGVPLAGATYGLSIPIGAVIGGAGGLLMR